MLGGWGGGEEGGNTRLIHLGNNVVILLHVHLILRGVQRAVLVHHLPHEAANLVEVAEIVVDPDALRTVHNLGGVGAGLVLLEVAVQVGLLAEAALAQRTPEGLLFVVNIADVALQVGGDGEGALAVLALVGLLPRVGAQVAGQVGRAREHLAAELAGVAVLGLAVQEPAAAAGEDVLIAAEAAQQRQRRRHKGRPGA